MQYASRQRVRTVLNYATFKKFASKRNFKEPVELIDLDDSDDKFDDKSDDNFDDDSDDDFDGIVPENSGDQNEERQRIFSRTSVNSVRNHVNWLPK